MGTVAVIAVAILIVAVIVWIADDAESFRIALVVAIVLVGMCVGGLALATTGHPSKKAVREQLQQQRQGEPLTPSGGCGTSESGPQC